MADKFYGEKIVFKAARLRFGDDSLFAPKHFKGDQSSKPRYSATFLIDPANVPQHAQALQLIEAEVKRAIQMNWGGKRPPKLDASFYGQGADLTNSEGAPYSGCDGFMFVKANSNGDSAPLLLSTDRRPESEWAQHGKFQTLPTGDTRLYNGAYVDVSLNLYIGPEKWGPKICSGLRSLRVLGYGEKFGGFDTKRDFDDFDTDDEGDSL